MQVPTIPMLSRLPKTHKISVAGMAAAGVGVLALTGVSGNSGTTAASDTGAVQQVSAWTPDTAQQQSLTAQADTAGKKTEQDAARKAAAAAKVREQAAQREQVSQAVNRSQQRGNMAVQASVTTAVSSGPQETARRLVGSAAQFQCFSKIVSHESGWNHRATNASSGAYGLVQALPGSKMASAGADWRTNPTTQIKWGLDYMNSRYGSPCAAWSFWQAHNWY
jgi:hypothetical protein